MSWFGNSPSLGILGVKADTDPSLMIPAFATGASIDLLGGSGRAESRGVQAANSSCLRQPAIGWEGSHILGTPWNFVQYSKTRGKIHQENPSHDHQDVLQGFAAQFLWDIFYVLV